MMHNKQPYSFEKTDVRGRFLLNFSCTKVQSKDVSPIAGNLRVNAATEQRGQNKGRNSRGAAKNQFAN